MHIPDGFIAPLVYLPAYVLATGAWAWAVRGVRRRLDEETIPRLAVVTAMAYVLGLVMLPLPGGSSGHLLGIAILAMLFGIRLAFLAYTLVLLLQALMFGAGGITALPVNALAIGLVGATVMVGSVHGLPTRYAPAAVVLGAFLAVTIPALMIALVLGIQPMIAQSEDGMPLFFPFGPEIALPAIVLPHLLIGGVEALLTLAVWRYARQRGWLG
ncbi:MAG: energy-coupling factor ABC transporter permease [Candidatus Thiodiazotropha sp. (ex Dulcina madagascariensis)]|nr:energy-coupling factor ABC transporter permease [Candidatus Thiodiazotropha sp. (ex Dulcina madagascariensis)]